MGKEFKVDKGSCAVVSAFPVGENREPNHALIENALEDFKTLGHRGASTVVTENGVQFDVGDGAGIKTDIPKEFFKQFLP